MSWIQVLFDTSADEAPRLADALEELNAEAVSFFDAEDQPLYEPPLGTTPLWNRTRVSGLYEAGCDMDTILAELARRLAPQPLPPYRLEPLADRDWIRAWMDSFKPMRFGQRLWIVPSWHEPPDAQGVNILLDPGLAFGTGTHPTTRLCLEWLDSHPPAAAQVIDYGCGSGILAIAAALLGAAQVWATDNDPQALGTAGRAGRRAARQHPRGSADHPGAALCCLATPRRGSGALGDPGGPGRRSARRLSVTVPYGSSADAGRLGASHRHATVIAWKRQPFWLW
jgi:ribosomal protein L11 methyltransferase